MYGIKYYVYVFLSKSISVFVCFLCIILLTTMTIYTQGDVWPHHHATFMSSYLRHLPHVQLHLTVSRNFSGLLLLGSEGILLHKLV